MSHFLTFTRRKVWRYQRVIRNNTFDTNVQLPTRLYDNRGDINVAIKIFPHIDSNIPTTSVTLYSDVFITSL